MNEKVHYLTEEGAERLREELDELKSSGRTKLAKRLRDAIQMGDLSENADYHKAKEDQAFLEGKIQEIQHLLQVSIIIDNKTAKREVVDVGASVTIQEIDSDPETYMVVGAKEADPRNGRISNESPIGRALLGRKIGDNVIAHTPGGQINFKILDIE